MSERRILKGSLIVYKFVPRFEHDLVRSLAEWEKSIEDVIIDEIGLLPNASYNLKIQLCMTLEFVKTEYSQNGTAEQRIIEHHITTESTPYNKFTYLRDITELLTVLTERFDAFVQNGSGYSLRRLKSFHLKLYRYKVLKGGGENIHRKLPRFIAQKKACVNIDCTHDLCFFYCCLATVLEKKKKKRKHAERNKQYDRILPMLVRTGISPPVKISDIPRFERENPMFCISVLGCQGQHFVPLYASIRKSAKYDVCLFLYDNHYYWVSNLARLLRKQTSSSCRHYFCHFCLQGFRTPVRLSLHESLCRKGLQTLKAGKGVIHFKNHRHRFRLPFAIYYDIESIVEKSDEAEIQRHKPISVCSWTVSQHEEFSTVPRVFSGETCIKAFILHLMREEKRILNILRNTNARMRLEKCDKLRYANAKRCEICHQLFDEQRMKCRDHDHLENLSTSNLRFITCSRCNLTFGATQYKIPIIAHNAMRYDISHVIKELVDVVEEIYITPKNSERPMCLRWKRNLCFIDSINFVQGSLDSLVSKLPREKLKPYLEHLTGGDEYKLDLLLKKAPFPYDYLNHVGKLNDDKLPPRECFFNTLTETSLKESEYREAESIWETFECKTFKHYMELYVILDVLLLAAVFETYRSSTYAHFGLDPTHYISAPSMCMDAMLKMTEVSLEKLADVDMYLYFSKAIRGGLCGSALRYVKANNEMMGGEYDPKSTTSHIMSFDANNLYGHSLSNPLPTSGFKWLTPEETKALDIINHPKEDPIGYFLEVGGVYSHIFSFSLKTIIFYPRPC